jgi:hypothetical protein
MKLKKLPCITLLVVLLTAMPAIAVAPASQTKAVKLYFILLDDNGKLGKRVGCNDSVVPVVVTIAPTTTPLRAAFEKLLSIKDDTYCETGLVNSLHQSSLTVQSVSISGRTAVLKLTGEYRDSGHCDTPRAQAQFLETARQFANIRRLKVFVNNEELTFDPTD